MTTTTDRKNPSVQLTDEITVSPRLSRLWGKLAENWGYSPLGFLEEEKRSLIESIRDDRHTRHRADKAGMTEEEYTQSRIASAPYVSKSLTIEREVYEKMEAAARNLGRDMDYFIKYAIVTATEKEIRTQN